MIWNTCQLQKCTCAKDKCVKLKLFVVFLFVCWYIWNSKKMVSIARSLSAWKPHWKLLFWILLFLYLLFWSFSRRLYFERSKFENIHYQVDFLELFDGPVSLKQDDPNLVRFIRNNFLKRLTQSENKQEVRRNFLQYNFL